MNIKRVVPNTTVTFTTSTGLMSSQIATPTNILPVSYQNLVGNTTVPASSSSILQTVVSAPLNLMATNVEEMTTGQAILASAMNLPNPHISNLLSSGNLIHQGSLVLSSTTTFPQNPVSENQESAVNIISASETSKVTTQPVSILPKTVPSSSVLVGPFKFVTNYSTMDTSSTSGYLIPITATNSQNVSQ